MIVLGAPPNKWKKALLKPIEKMGKIHEQAFHKRENINGS